MADLVPIPVPSALVEFILLGPQDDRRQLQDSPVLGDVWVEFGRQPAARLDLLIGPFRGEHSGEVAGVIDDGLERDRHPNDPDHPDERDDLANIAFLQGLIVARLTFDQVMRVVAPRTKWWLSRWKERKPEGAASGAGDTLPQQMKEGEQGDSQEADVIWVHEVMNFTETKLLSSVLKSASSWHSKTGRAHSSDEAARLQDLPSLNRFWALTGLILWAGKPRVSPGNMTRPEEQISYILDNASAESISELLIELKEKMLEESRPKTKSKPLPLVWQVSLNRRPMPAISKSIPAVKADAATYLFKVNCSEIGWAVIDSGIDGSHPAFEDSEGNSRVKRSFDFKNFRRIVSLSNTNPSVRTRNIAELLKDNASLRRPLKVGDDLDKESEVHKDLFRLAEDARKRGPVRWELVERYVEINPGSPTQTNHGTHVAGIIGASKKAVESSLARAAAKAAAENVAPEGVAKLVHKESSDSADGMCPDIQLYDFRVLGPSIDDAEFAIIAALQFIRYLNDRDNFLTIHGANLSLSIPHDVRNFACGRTPICDECERLVSSGVVVVAAAGNHGYKSFETKDGSYDSYAAFSITDPGNADSVLTVGATHRYWPHTYGVSFFSSRGPTGDGRLKPDLVAPGERIHAPMPGGEWGDLDGTSMAAPHVSGAAAMLMARYSELVGQPRRIKGILCESATDLARERSFQGHGMLDVLRAFQSI